MGKTIVIEEKVCDYISSLYGKHRWQIGLMIGQLSMQRDYVVHFARSPEQPDSPDAGMECKPGSMDTDLDSSWIVEHARQVSRMLTGGLDIAGIFVFGPPDMLSKAQGKIRQVLYTIDKTVFHRPAAYFEASEACSQSRILLQICSKTKKITCRTINVSDPKATPNPAEVKYQSFVSKWLKLETSLSLRHLHFTVPKKLERSGLQTQVVVSIHSLLQKIAAALCTVNGEFASDEQFLALGEKQGKSSQTGSKASQPFKVDIYTEQPKGKFKPEEREAIGTFSINGSVSCRAYVNQKATVGDASHAIKYDAVRSILSRFEVLFEDIVDNQKNANEETLSATWTSPKRVFARLGDGPITVCDYMFKDETLQECRERMAELLNISPKDEDLESAEVFPDVHTVNSLMEEMETMSKQKKMKNVEAEDSPLQDGFGRRVIGVVVGALVAIAAAGITLLWGDQTGPETTS